MFVQTYDADSVVTCNCKSHNNLSQRNDGGGFDFDGSTTNSVIEFCTSYNNYGYGYAFYSDTTVGGRATNNVTVRHSSSTNDSTTATSLFAATQVVANLASGTTAITQVNGVQPSWCGCLLCRSNCLCLMFIRIHWCHVYESTTHLSWHILSNVL
jgi:hypothetical protein